MEILIETRQNTKMAVLTHSKKMVLKNILDKVVELVGGGSVINGAYPV